MTKHTPGPWIKIGECVREFDTTDLIARPGHNFSVINPSQTLEANANLIAAAPDLLEAAKEALAECGDITVSKILRAAIAQAEGDQ